MIWAIVFFILPWIGWIALAFRVQKQQKTINELKNNSVPKEDYKALQEIYKELLIKKYLVSVPDNKDLVSVSVDKSIIKEVVDRQK